MGRVGAQAGFLVLRFLYGHVVADGGAHHQGAEYAVAFEQPDHVAQQHAAVGPVVLGEEEPADL